jgi:hypothetical protein
MCATTSPPAGDADGQALLARFKGRRLPMVDRVEVSIIEENQPRWLSFLNGEHDWMANAAGPLSRRIGAQRQAGAQPGQARASRPQRCRGRQRPAVLQHGDPVVGGYTPDKVALRRAIGLAYDVDREIRLCGAARPCRRRA